MFTYPYNIKVSLKCEQYDLNVNVSKSKLQKTYQEMINNNPVLIEVEVSQFPVIPNAIIVRYTKCQFNVKQSLFGTRLAVPGVVHIR